MNGYAPVYIDLGQFCLIELLVEGCNGVIDSGQLSFVLFFCRNIQRIDIGLKRG
jgi:hypothetical protein